MKLQDFVSDCISQIIDGIEDAKKKVVNKRAIICPYVCFERGTFVIGNSKNGDTVHKVSFDVSVEVVEKDGTFGGELSVSAAGFGATVKKESDDKGHSSNTSRVQFDVFLYLPGDYEKAPEAASTAIPVRL